MRPAIRPELFTFRISWRIRFSDVDMQGVVHHSEIVKYLEVGRVEYWRQLGIGYQDFLDSGLQYVVARVECNYFKPLSFDRIVTVYVRVSSISRTSITYEYLVFDDAGDCAVQASTVLVCLRQGKNRPHPLPGEYTRRILDYEVRDSVEKTAGMKSPAE